MEKYRFLKDLTSDVLFEAFGKTEEELFENAAEAVFAVQAKIDEIKPVEKLEFKFGGEDLKHTLFRFLNDLIAEAEIAELFLSKFDVKLEKAADGKYKGKVTARGEPISPQKGETVVKAVTLYKFDVQKTDNGFKATVVCDI
jgi:SHS2 domain-containing protein